MGETTSHSERRAVIGNADNFWLYSSETGFDLTHPPKPSSPPVKPRVTIETDTSPITIDPSKSALIVIDMQNFFLSPVLGRAKGPGHDALDQLVENAVPACRKAGIRVMWVNWGLTAQEVSDMPPATKRAFGFEAVEDDCLDALDSFEEKENGFGVDKYGMARSRGAGTMKDGRIYKGLGSEMGVFRDPETGKEINAGKLLMRDQWNTDLCPPLDKLYKEGSQVKSKPDVWIHKNRMSGMWGAQTECGKFLEQEGLRTLFFAGVNTDQCVNGTYQDCFSKGYDCILLSDGCGTTSPDYAQKCIEYNAANTCGFSTSCKKLAEGVAAMD